MSEDSLAILEQQLVEAKSHYTETYLRDSAESILLDEMAALHYVKHEKSKALDLWRQSFQA